MDYFQTCDISKFGSISIIDMVFAKRKNNVINRNQINIEIEKEEEKFKKINKTK